jgi:UDP-N-acetylglucosamine 2-epimerase (non-hydrolysing)
MNIFSLTADYDLNIMKPGQDLSYITRSVLEGVSEILKTERPDWIIVQGDTTSAFASALAGFYANVPVAHVEAGLRTFNPMSPWPEEVNRSLISSLAKIHFAPTCQAANNLLKENVEEKNIFITGNTVIDALKWVAALGSGRSVLNSIYDKFCPDLLTTKKKILLVTLHRRENLGEKLRDICGGLKIIAQRDDVEIVIPLHLNPLVQETVREILGNNPSVHILPPLEYLPFIHLLSQCYFVITDSGGMQEEAPGLGKPVLVVRDTTERPEAMESGTAILVGTNGVHLASKCTQLIERNALYSQMSNARNPFGDGTSSIKIVSLLKQHLA